MFLICFLVLFTLLVFGQNVPVGVVVSIVRFDSVDGYELSNPWAVYYSEISNRVYFSNVAYPAGNKDWIGRVNPATRDVQFLADSSGINAGFNPSWHVKDIVEADGDLFLAVFSNSQIPPLVVRCSEKNLDQCAVFHTGNKGQSFQALAASPTWLYVAVADGLLENSVIIGLRLSATASNQMVTGDDNLKVVVGVEEEHGLRFPVGLAVDPKNRFIFWSNEGQQNRLVRATLNSDGSAASDPRNLLPSDAETYPFALALDVSGNHIYWTDQSSEKHGIWRTTLDGSKKPESVVLFDDQAIIPHGISINSGGKTLYWAEVGDVTVNALTIDDIGIVNTSAATQMLPSLSFLIKNKPQMIFCSKGDSCLHDVDFDSLQDGEWLTDAALHFGQEVLVGEEECRAKGWLVVAPATSFLLQSLPGPGAGEEILGEEVVAHVSVMALFVNNNIRVDRAYGGSHWSLVVYRRAAKQWTHYDSLNGANDSSAQRLVSKFRTLPSTLVSDYSVTQVNSSDCGVYCLALLRACLSSQHGEPASKKSQVNEFIVADLRKRLREVALQLHENTS